MDLDWRKSNVDLRMNKALMLLNPSVSIKDEKMRAMAPLARRVARGLTTMDFLHRLPAIDAEYKGPNNGEDHSNFIEDLTVLLADRAQVKNRIKQVQATLLWSPVAFVKCGMHLLGIERDDGKTEATPDQMETMDDFKDDLEEVPQEVAAALNLAAQEIPELDGSFSSKIVRDPLPQPTTSLDIPWVDWVDPRHIVTDRGANEVPEVYYIGHLIVRTMSQFKNNPEYKNKEKVQAYAVPSSEGKDKRGDVRQMLGNPLMKSFGIPSAKEVVVLCEVYIREDPDNSRVRQMVGTLDLMSEVWVKEPRPNPLGVYPYVSIKAADEAPGIWSGPSYIEQAYDDIEELAWAKLEFRKHVRNYRTHKDLIPEALEFDAPELAKFMDPEYSGPVRYQSGNPNQILNGHRPPAMPNALIQWKSLVESDFTKNTGVTATQQGEGASNKVATAFRQEAQFSNERRGETRYRLYQAYAEIMLIITYLIQRYMTQPVEVKRGSIKMQFSGDTLKGIMGYTIDVIDMERSDPLSDRLLEVQTIERILGHPQLAAQFNPRELAKRVAQLNRWGNRVLAPEPERGAQGPVGAQAGAQGAENPSNSGTSGILGDGVDSGQEKGDTVDAVEGAAQRR